MVHVCVLFGSTMQFVVHLLSLSSSTVSSDKTVIVHPCKNDVWSARKKNQYNQPKVPGGNSPNLNGSQLKPFSFSQVLAKFQALSDWFCNWITKFYDTCSFSPTLFTVLLSQSRQNWITKFRAFCTSSKENNNHMFFFKPSNIWSGQQRGLTSLPVRASRQDQLEQKRHFSSISVLPKWQPIEGKETPHNKQ